MRELYDTDPNLTNVLIGPDRTVYRVDSAALSEKARICVVKKTGEMRPPAVRKTKNPQGR